MSLGERLDTLEANVKETGSIEDVGECPLCRKDEPPFWNGSAHIALYQDIVKRFILSKKGLERCTKELHNELESINEELEKTINFFERALHTTSYFDYNSMMYGVCDIDDSKPREVIKLFLDFDIMEFVLKRQYDRGLWWFSIEEGQTHYNDLMLFYMPIKQAKLKTTYENCRTILRQLDKVWLHSLNPDDYDKRPDMPEYKKRHVGFVTDNTTSNKRPVDEARSKFDEWKAKTEQELGKRLTYKNFGDVS